MRFKSSLFLATIMCFSIAQTANADSTHITENTTPASVVSTNNNTNLNLNNLSNKTDLHNTNNIRNDVNNLNAQGQSQRQAQFANSNSTSASKSNSNSSSASKSSSTTGASTSNSGSNSGGNTFSNSYNDQNPASTAIGSNVSFGQKNCGASVSFGIQTLFHGHSFGLPVPTPKCDARQDLEVGIQAAQTTSNPKFWSDVLMESFVTGDSKRAVYTRRAIVK